MPISQSRLVLLVEAAEQISSVYFALSEQGLEIIAKLRARKITGTEALVLLENLLMFPEGPIGISMGRINAERIKWQYTNKKNLRDKERKRKKRRGEGVREVANQKMTADLESLDPDVQAELAAMQDGLPMEDPFGDLHIETPGVIVKENAPDIDFVDKYIASLEPAGGKGPL